MKELTALPVNAAILDTVGTIVSVNDTWKEFARQNGLRLANFGIGSNYLQFCVPDGQYPSLSATNLKELLVGRKKLLTLIYPCDSPTNKRWFSLIGLHLSPEKGAGVAMLHINLTDTFPIGADQTLTATSSKRQIRGAANLNSISEAIERSVLETVSSQLNIMGLDAHHGAAHDASTHDAEEVGAQLSKRQMEVLRLLGEGKSNKEIANALFRSPHTIKLHVSAILQQLNLKSRTQAALLASKIYKQGSADRPRTGADAWKKASTAPAPRPPGRSVREKDSID